MKSVAGIILVAAVLAASGCRNPGNSADMKEELRKQEDYIYQLEDWVRKYHDQLESCSGENKSLREKLGSGGSSSGGPVHVSPFDDSGGRGPKLPDVEIPKVEIPGTETPPPKSGGTNSAEPMPFKSSSAMPADDRTSSSRLRQLIDATTSDTRARQNAEDADVAEDAQDASAAGKGPHEARLVSFETGPTANTQIVRITLNRLLTRGLSRGERGGDEEVMVLVEPRNSANQLIPPVGQLSISVIDPAATSDADARVARWDLSEEETAKAYRHSPLGDGIQLNLKWPNRPPLHSRVNLYARLTMPNGPKLMAMRSLEVNLPPGPPPGESDSTAGALVPEPESRPGDTFEVRPLGTTPTPATGVPTLASAVSTPAWSPPVGSVVPPGAVPSPPATPLPSPERPVAIPNESGRAAAAVTSSEPVVRTSDRRPEWTPYR